MAIGPRVFPSASIAARLKSRFRCREYQLRTSLAPSFPVSPNVSIAALVSSVGRPVLSRSTISGTAAAPPRADIRTSSSALLI
jgi:hypothetical protein